MLEKLLRILQALKTCLVSVVEIETALHRLEQKVETMAAKLQDFKDEVTGANAEVDKIVLKIQALLDQIAGGGMTIPEQDEALALVQGLRGRLAAVAVPVENPNP